MHGLAVDFDMCVSRNDVIVDVRVPVDLMIVHVHVRTVVGTLTLGPQICGLMGILVMFSCLTYAETECATVLWPVVLMDGI